MASITALSRMLEEASTFKGGVFDALATAVHQINCLSEELNKMKFAIRDLESQLVNQQVTEEPEQILDGDELSNLIFSRFYLDFEDMVSLDTSETRNGVEVLLCVDNSEMEQAVKDEVVRVIDDLISDGKIIIKEGKNNE